MENKGMKVAILCSEEKLGQIAYQSISSMPTDNYVNIFLIEKANYSLVISIDRYFEEVKKKVEVFMDTEKDCQYFFYIGDALIEIEQNKYLVTVACSAFKGEEPVIGTSGLVAIKSSDQKRLIAGEIPSDKLFELPLEERAREASQNARSLV